MSDPATDQATLSGAWDCEPDTGPLGNPDGHRCNGCPDCPSDCSLPCGWDCGCTRCETPEPAAVREMEETAGG